MMQEILDGQSGGKGDAHIPWKRAYWMVSLEDASGRLCAGYGIENVGWSMVRGTGWKEVMHELWNEEYLVTHTFWKKKWG
jgi:hypothetical protein